MPQLPLRSPRSLLISQASPTEGGPLHPVILLGVFFSLFLLRPFIIYDDVKLQAALEA